jgi:hypothetical protein
LTRGSLEEGVLMHQTIQAAPAASSLRYSPAKSSISSDSLPGSAMTTT